MPARVQIIVEAKDAASGILRGITSQFGALGTVMDDLTTRNINWGNIATSATMLVVDGLKQSMQATMEYAQQVRDLSLASGQGAEETSRMLQVMDDFQLTADDATTAVRTLTKEGLAPTMDTLADLADQYVGLNDAQAKNELILKNLGRSGLQWANMLSKGGDALRQMSASVNDNLILTDASIKASEEYRLTLDQWNDAVQGVKVSIGSGLLPVLTDLMNWQLDNARAAELAKEQGISLTFATKAQVDAIREQVAAERDAANAKNDTTNAANNESGALDNNTDAAKTNADAMKELSRANQAVLSNMFTLQSASESYAEGEADRAGKLAAIEAERNQLILQTNALRASGQMTLEKQNELTARGIELEQEYAAVQAEGVKATADAEEVRKKMIYSMLEQKLAQDGITDSKDVQYLQDTAVQMGLVDRASADAAISAAKAADALFAGFTQGLPPLTVTRDTLGQIASFNGRTVTMDIVLNVLSSFPSMTNTPNGSGYQQWGGIGGYANGGSVYAGRPIMVGEQGPEVFVPAANGEIIPNGGKTVNIYISGEFRNVNDLDYLAQEVSRRIS